MQPFEVRQFRVDEREWFVLRLRDVDHDDALMHVDLTRREADAGRVVHRLKHVVDESADCGVTFATGFAFVLRRGSGNVSIGSRAIDRERA